MYGKNFYSIKFIQGRKTKIKIINILRFTI